MKQQRQRGFLLMLLLVLLSACASNGGGGAKNALEQAQYDWISAIRWSNFEAAVPLIDAQLQAQKPVSALELSRYQQVQISGYRVLGQELSADGQHAQRDVEISVVNRHTMAERTVRHTETWRFDAAEKRWWNTSGLPDLWVGH